MKLLVVTSLNEWKRNREMWKQLSYDLVNKGYGKKVVFWSISKSCPCCGNVHKDCKLEYLIGIMKNKFDKIVSITNLKFYQKIFSKSSVPVYHLTDSKKLLSNINNFLN